MPPLISCVDHRHHQQLIRHAATVCREVVSMAAFAKSFWHLHSTLQPRTPEDLPRPGYFRCDRCGAYLTRFRKLVLILCTRIHVLLRISTPVPKSVLLRVGRTGFPRLNHAQATTPLTHAARLRHLLAAVHHACCAVFYSVSWPLSSQLTLRFPPPRHTPGHRVRPPSDELPTSVACVCPPSRGRAGLTSAPMTPSAVEPPRMVAT